MTWPQSWSQYTLCSERTVQNTYRKAQRNSRVEAMLHCYWCTLYESPMAQAANHHSRVPWYPSSWNMWNWQWTEWHWDKLVSRLFCCPLSVPLHSLHLTIALIRRTSGHLHAKRRTYGNRRTPSKKGFINFCRASKGCSVTDRRTGWRTGVLFSISIARLRGGD